MPWVSSARLGKERESVQLKSSEEPILRKDVEAGNSENAEERPKTRPSPPLPFQFGYRRHPIDWRVLHGVDIERLIRETDIETLERCVAAVTFGDLESEDARNLSEINFMRIFRLGQLTAEYLLHVQDRLAYDNELLKDEKAHKEKHILGLRSRCEQHKDALNTARQDIKRLKKTIKTLEEAVVQEQNANKAAALPVPVIPQAPSAEEQGSRWKLERLERLVKELQEERSTLLASLAKTKAALTKKNLDEREEAASEVQRVRAEERKTAQQRLRAAHQELQDLRFKLDSLASKHLELQRTAAADLDNTRSDLTLRQRDHEEEARSLKAQLEDKEALLKLSQDKAKNALADVAKAESKVGKLERQLMDTSLDLDASSAAVQEIEALQSDIDDLKEKVKKLRQESQDVRAENAVLLREKQDLDQKLHELEVSLKKQADDSRDARESEEMEAEALRRELEGKRKLEEDAERKRKAEEARRKKETEHEVKEEVSKPYVPPIRTRSTPLPASLELPFVDANKLPPRSLNRPWATLGFPPSPSRGEQLHWGRDHPHEMRPWDRPGVLSRTPIPRSRFTAQRPEIQELLEGELNEELKTYGIDPEKQQLTDKQYDDVIAELESRQAAAEAESSPRTAARIQEIRRNLSWHLHKVADNVDKEYTILANGQVAAQQRASAYQPQPEPVLPPLRRSRSVSPPKRKGIFGNLCKRFRSPSKREQRAKARVDQAQALAAYRDSYGHSPLMLGPTSGFKKEAEKKNLREASERFYQPLMTGTHTMSQEEMRAQRGLKHGKSGGSLRTNYKIHRHRSPSKSRELAAEMSTFKKMGPSKPHATLHHRPKRSFMRQLSYGSSSEDESERGYELPRKVLHTKVTETWEKAASSSSQQTPSDTESRD